MAKGQNPEQKTEYKKLLKQFRSGSARHVLVVEASLTEDQKRHIFRYADEVRKAGNVLTGIMQGRYKQLIRTKKYRALRKLYKEYSVPGKEKELSNIKRQMNAMCREYGVTWAECRDLMKEIKERYPIGSIPALTKAESVWQGIEKVLYSDGKMTRFKKRGDLPAIRAKQYNSAIVMSAKDGRLWFRFDVQTKGEKDILMFTYRTGDRFVEDEMEAILTYLDDPEGHDWAAVEDMLQYGTFADTYRPCYASLVCKEIRGKLRVFVHITIEGKAVRKYDKDGNPRHSYGTGRIGADIGTQSLACTADDFTYLDNLAERGPSIMENERKERLLNRMMDRSRRATNPDNYNPDGTIRKGRKTWHYSKRYQKLKKQWKSLARRNAVNRHYAIDETVNRLRAVGDTFITEPKNAKKLQKKAKDGEKDKKGRPKRRKRFGKSIKNRCPGYLQQKTEQVFTTTGGSYIEVPNSYKASQYDHTADDYIKKRLSDRMFCLKDGTKVQRDWYSSFLLYCADDTYETVDKARCDARFDGLYRKEQQMIEAIRKSGKKVMNSGIKTA